VAAASASYPALKRAEQAVILTAAVVLFLFWGGPIWRRFADWNAAIAWSYGLIPLLVLAWLAAKRQLAWRPWALHSVEIAAVKFVITASVLMAVMLGRGPSAPRPVSKAPGPTVGLSAPFPPAPVRRVAPDAFGGEIAGEVTDASGVPGRGWVWLEGFSGALTEDAPPVNPEQGQGLTRLQERGDGFDPPFSVMAVGDAVQVSSLDRRLHTARFRTGETLFTVPVPAEGQSPVHVVARSGEAQLDCTVHGASEPPARILVLDHPFFARTGPDGRFQISRVPPGDYRLVATALDGRGRTERPVHIDVGQRQDLAFSLKGGAP
jgi:hypothetical protein